MESQHCAVGSFAARWQGLAVSLAGRSTYRPVWELANEYRLPLLICGDTAEVGRVAERYPEAAILRSHAGFDYAGARECMAVARECPNFYLDMTSALRTHGLIEYVVSEIGADQVLYGSDIPLYDMRWCVGSILFARISDEDKRKILGLNMKQVLDRTLIE